MHNIQNTIAEALHNKNCLLVASTGGHLAQLVRLADASGIDDSSVWVTFENEQSRSLLQGRNVIFVDYIRSRDLKGIFKASRKAQELFRQRSFETVISTGAGLALSFLPLARNSADRVIYVESVSRFDGPSATGKLIQAFPYIETFTQHSNWANKRWKPTAGVLGSFTKRVKSQPSGHCKLFITLGTIEKYRFDRLVDSVLALGICNEDTIWQVGSTDRTDLPGQVHVSMSAESFELAAREAEIVITHSGVGTILQLLEWGIYPVVAARSAVHREHVDNHQFQIANYLSEFGLAVISDPSDLNINHILEASKYEVSPEESGTAND